MSTSVSRGPGAAPVHASKIIFLSYRRGDASSASGRLSDGLKQRYGDAAVFLDVEDIEPSENFVREIHEALARTAILVVVIGPDWRREPDPGRPDYVVEEVKTALGLGIPIAPVLVEGGTMPEAVDLPGEVRDLADINALPIHHTSWDDGFRDLTEVIEKRAGILPVAGAVEVGEMAKASGKGKRGCSVQVSIAVALAAMVLVIPVLMQPAITGRRIGPDTPGPEIGKDDPFDPSWPMTVPTVDTVMSTDASPFDTTSDDSVEFDTAEPFSPEAP